MVTRAEQLEDMTPDLIADVVLYETSVGGREVPALPGFGCTCMLSRDRSLYGYDARLLLGDEPLHPGQARRLGFVFLTPEGRDAVFASGRFYLWEGRFIGEAIAVEAGPNRFASPSSTA